MDTVALIIFIISIMLISYGVIKKAISTYKSREFDRFFNDTRFEYAMPNNEALIFEVLFLNITSYSFKGATLFHDGHVREPKVTAWFINKVRCKDQSELIKAICDITSFKTQGTIEIFTAKLKDVI